MGLRLANQNNSGRVSLRNTEAIVGTVVQRGWTPYNLFRNGEQGAWYDPSDFSTLYQDAAGTTPVTALGQPVGLMLDRSGNGNHAAQATAAARPTVQARVNLLERTEEFDQSPWNDGSNTTVTPNAAIAPDGTNTAARVEMPVASGTFLQQAPNMVVGVQYTLSVWAKANGNTNLTLFTNSEMEFQAITLTNDWARYSYTFTFDGVWSTNTGIGNGSGTVDAFIWGAQLEQNSTATTYQRVTTATDYADIGLPRYLEFDGVDDAMATQSVDFSSTDEMTVCAGVYKESDAAVGIVAELSASWFFNNGTFTIQAPHTVAPAYYFGSNGTSPQSASVNNAIYSAPQLSVLTGNSDISLDNVLLRQNGLQIASSSADQGTGNYGDYPLYIGARGGTSLEFNGRIHQLIIRGATTAGALLDQTERFVARKTGVTL